MNKIYLHEIVQKFQKETKLTSKEANDLLKQNNIKLHNSNTIKYAIEKRNEELNKVTIPDPIYKKEIIHRYNWITDKRTFKTSKKCINSKEIKEVQSKKKLLKKQILDLEILVAIIELYDQQYSDKNSIKEYVGIKNLKRISKNQRVKEEVDKLKQGKANNDKTTDELLHSIALKLNLSYEATKFNYYYKSKNVREKVR